jgi:membrane protein involved in colicin uptake
MSVKSDGTIEAYNTVSFGEDQTAAEKTAAAAAAAAAADAAAKNAAAAAADAAAEGASVAIIYSKTTDTFDLIPLDTSGAKCSSGTTCGGETFEAYMKRVPAGTEVRKSDKLYSGSELQAQSGLSLVIPADKIPGAPLPAEFGTPKLVLQVNKAGTIVSFIKPHD